MSFISLNAVGDVALNNRYMEIVEKAPDNRIFENVKHCFEKVDINFANLEMTLSTRGARGTKNQLVWGSPKSINVLKNVGFNVLSLANNHICDYGFEGCIDTVKFLQDNNINCFGVGDNLRSSTKPLIIKRNGIAVGFLGYLCKTTNGKNSTKKSYGSAPMKYSYIKRDLRELSAKVNIKIVSLHWGFEQYNYPSPKQIHLAHKIIKAGADLIIGHHPHVLQGYEIYKTKPIFYSLGNFIFDDVVCQNGGCLKWHEDNKLSIIVKMNISKTKVSVSEVIPVRLNESLRLELVVGREKKDMIQKIGFWSQMLEVKNYGMFWKGYRIEREVRNGLPQLDFQYVLKNLFKIRLRHVVYMFNQLKKCKRYIVKYLLIKGGFNPNQYN